MVKFRANAMSIFVASALVLFMSPVRSAFAHPASPVAKTFFAQDGQGQEQENGQGQNQDIQDDLYEGPDTDVNEGPEDANEEAKDAQGEAAEMDGDHNDGALHESQIDEDRTEDEQNDEHEDVAAAPPAA